MRASADVNAATRLAGEEGTTPVMYAAVGGREDAVLQLLQAGAALNAKRACDDRTALHLAASWGHANSMSTLVT